jgi:hypothetical protein
VQAVYVGYLHCRIELRYPMMAWIKDTFRAYAKALFKHKIYADWRFCKRKPGSW